MRCLLGGFALVILSSSSPAHPADVQHPDHGESLGPTVRAAFIDRDRATVGDAVLQQTANGVLLRVNLRGIRSGTHAFHIHETGRCDPPTFASAGSHVAQGGGVHGFLNEGGPHAGDLPNIHVPAAGDVSVDLFLHEMTLDEDGKRSLLDADGSALIVHENTDDYRTDPTGSAGDRIACAVVTR